MDLYTKNKLKKDMKSLHPPSFFKSEVSKIVNDFDKQLDITMQLYVMKNKSTDANTNYNSGLNKINIINTSLLQVDSKVKKEIIACNKIIMELDSEINQLKKKAGPDMVDDMSSKQMVSDYSDNYKNKLYICIFKVILILIIAYFLINVSNYMTFFGVIIIFIVIKWVIIYVRNLFRRYPQGPNNIIKIDYASPVTVDHTDTCMGKECCDSTTKWVQGKGCMQI